MEFDSYRTASRYAKEKSKENPGIVWYVNWLDSDQKGTDYWDVSIYQEYPDQSGYLNGFEYSPDSYY